MTVVVIAEIENDALTTASQECVEEAREVATGLEQAVTAILMGAAVEHLAPELIAHGADTVLVIEHETLSQFSADGWLNVLEGPLSEIAFSLLLAPDSAHTRSWLPRLALRRRLPLVTGCSQVRVEQQGRLELTRPVYKGLQSETLRWAGETSLLATLAPGVRGISGSSPSEAALSKTKKIRPTLDEAVIRDQTVAQHPPDAKVVDVSEAERIVSGGLGIGSAEAVALLWQLAEPLGATVAGTRVISDRHWIPHERYIGSTGKTVAPKLYIALGISGASQHTVGMADSETIIAINIDRTAPIFGLADLGIVGDLHEILPKLIERLGDAAYKY